MERGRVLGFSMEELAGEARDSDLDKGFVGFGSGGEGDRFVLFCFVFLMFSLLLWWISPLFLDL